jgi:hypothetical protein
VLLPASGAGMRIETPAGDLIEQLQASPRTLTCPDVDQKQCAAAAKDFAAYHVAAQIAHSAALASFVAHRPAAAAH